MVPTTLRRHSKSSGVVTMTSTGVRIFRRALRISSWHERLVPDIGITTSRSTSLFESAVPRACEPNRITRSGWNSSTTRWTIWSIVFWVAFFATVLPLESWPRPRHRQSRSSKEIPGRPRISSYFVLEKSKCFAFLKGRNGGGARGSGWETPIGSIKTLFRLEQVFLNQEPGGEVSVEHGRSTASQVTEFVRQIPRGYSSKPTRGLRRGQALDFCVPLS